MASDRDSEKNQTTIRYRRLRAPKAHGTSLQEPPLNDSSRLLTENKRIALTPEWEQIRNQARSEIQQAAIDYTRQYRDVDQSARDASTVIMSGHQPSLFHPGVWFKNFSLSRLAKKHNALAINLVVDNDICGVAALRAPAVDDEGGSNARFQMLPIDTPGDNIPFEVRAIQDVDFFKSFEDRAREAIKSMVDDPLVSQLWPLVIQHAGNSAMGAAFSKGRHQLEGTIGLNTFEIPISTVSQTRSFASFIKLIASDIVSFQSAYNTSLEDYRKVHKIRSRSHPVPSLEAIDGWYESPFWIWNSKNPIRRSLYFQTSSAAIKASDRQSFETTLSFNDFENQLLELGNQNIAIRPKALMTTMFTRLALCDLFIHGIGGSKYDQLTDAIMQDYFGIQPPKFMTLTASMKLTNSWESVNREAVNKRAQRLRELTFQPERFIDATNAAAAESIREKEKWISEDSTDRLYRHIQIGTANANLQPFVQSQRDTEQKELSRIKSQLRTSQILGSREYSFCLHPQELIESLRRLAH